jgi:hypothetical protein
MDGQRHAPAALLQVKAHNIHFIGLQCRPERVRKILPSTVFEPLTVESLASRYTDYNLPTNNFFRKEKDKVLNL